MQSHFGSPKVPTPLISPTSTPFPWRGEPGHVPESTMNDFSWIFVSEKTFDELLATSNVLQAACKREGVRALGRTLGIH